MAKLKIFISYDYDNDRNYKNILKAWDKNDLFDFTFYDHSIDVSINSTSADYIRSVIKSKILSSDIFLCIIGKETYKSSWVNWEIDKAVSLKMRIVAVKIESHYTSPPNIVGVGASWAKSFTFESIKNAIN